MKKSPYKWGVILLLVALIWGTTFAVMKDLLNQQLAEVFLFWRFFLASILLALWAGKNWLKLKKRDYLKGFLLGFLLYLGYILQVWGLNYTKASQAGFITGLAVVFVPLIAIFAKHEAWSNFKILGSILATLGLFLLTYAGPLAMGLGELLILLCAFFFALYIVLLGVYAPKVEATPFVAWQMFIVSIFLFFTLLFSQGHLPWSDLSFNRVEWLQILYLSLVATAFTFLAEHKAQQVLSATFTALALAMEPVFAALFAFFYLGERMTLWGYLGGSLIVLGMVVAGKDEK